MKNSSVLIVGCGDLGIRLGSSLVQHGCSVTGARRNPGKLPPGFTGRAADYTQPGSLVFAEQLRPDFVVAIFNPADRSVSGYKAGFRSGMRNLLSGLGAHRPRHILMTSSTRVFAEADGGWVDESSDLSTTDAWAQEIIAAERLLLDSGHSASVVRLAGVYGIPGGRLLSRIRRGELCPPQPVSYTNRIHRVDCAGFLEHLLKLAAAGNALEPVYIGADDLPAARYEVESWLASEMGLDPQQNGDPESSTEPTRHNSAGHKRCRNHALRASGYQLIFPDYKSGYTALLTAPQ
ncbi:MAG: epimerase [Halioglobus sp.]|nr:epimerase [Halioglobus sp.]